MDGTQNFYPSELHNMEFQPNEKANDIGSRLPYHLQYVRDGKVNVKPEEVKDESKNKSK